MAREIVFYSSTERHHAKFVPVEIEMLQRLPGELFDGISRLMTDKLLKKMKKSEVLNTLDRILDHIQGNIDNYSHNGYRFTSGPCADETICGGCTSGLRLVNGESQQIYQIEVRNSACILSELSASGVPQNERVLQAGEALETQMGSIVVERAGPDQLLQKLKDAADFLRNNRGIRASSC